MNDQPITETVPEATVVEATAPKSSEPRNFLAAFLLTTMFGTLGLRHFYLGDKKLGWLRTGLFVGGYVVGIISAIFSVNVLSFLAGIAIFIAGIWAIVDFFYVYFNVRKDADGQALVATTRDKKWAKVLFWITIGLIAVTLIATLSIGMYAQTLLKDYEDIRNGNTQQNTLDQFDTDYDYRSMYN